LELSVTATSKIEKTDKLDFCTYLHNDRCVCFVDSDNPSQAVLTRNLFERNGIGGYWGTAIILAGLIFVGAVASFLYFLNRNSTPTETAETNESTNVKRSWSATQQWMLSIIWNSILGTITYFAWVGEAPISFFILFLGLFWLIGVTMIAVAVRSTFIFLRRKKPGLTSCA
jgi:cellulose synthase/poly-beta-1,6-N-acetylglucosamine synthase-like glycosyltransferase